MVIHIDWDDTMVLQPLDDLMDCFIMEGKAEEAALARLQVMRPNGSSTTIFQAMFTTETTNNEEFFRQTGMFQVQGGFFAIRPNIKVFNTSLIDIVQAGN